MARVAAFSSALIILIAAASAAADPDRIDLGAFPPSRFRMRAEIPDPVGVGDANYTFLSNGEITAKQFSALYVDIVTSAITFLGERGLSFDRDNRLRKHLVFKIVSFTQLNDPDAFADSDAHCLNGPWVETGCNGHGYFGRTIFDALRLTPIVVYVAFTKWGPRTGEYYYFDSIAHEVCHAIYLTQGWHKTDNLSEEHRLIDEFAREYVRRRFGRVARNDHR